MRQDAPRCSIEVFSARNRACDALAGSRGVADDSLHVSPNVGYAASDGEAGPRESTTPSVHHDEGSVSHQWAAWWPLTDVTNPSSEWRTPI